MNLFQIYTLGSKAEFKQSCFNILQLRMSGFPELRNCEPVYCQLNNNNKKSDSFVFFSWTQIQWNWLQPHALIARKQKCVNNCISVQIYPLLLVYQLPSNSWSSFCVLRLMLVKLKTGSSNFLSSTKIMRSVCHKSCSIMTVLLGSMRTVHP